MAHIEDIEELGLGLWLMVQRVKGRDGSIRAV